MGFAFEVESQLLQGGGASQVYLFLVWVITIRIIRRIIKITIIITMEIIVVTVIVIVIITRIIRTTVMAIAIIVMILKIITVKLERRRIIAITIVIITTPYCGIRHLGFRLFVVWGCQAQGFEFRAQGFVLRSLPCGFTLNPKP